MNKERIRLKEVYISMKKFLSFLLASLCTASLTLNINADSTEYGHFYIPKADIAPTIDGVITGNEWDNALTIPLTTDTTELITGVVDVFPTTEIRWLWDEEGLYFFGDVKDGTPTEIVHEPDSGSYNKGDGLQFCIYPDTTVIGTAPGNMYFFSLVINKEGETEIGEHFTFGSVNAGADVPDVVSACTQNGTNYTIEAFLPASCLTKSTTPILMEDGTEFAMTHVIMESDENRQALIIDSAWFFGPAANKYTLVNTIPEPDEETEVESTVDLPSASGEKTDENNTATGTIIAVVSGVLAASAIVLINKKRKQ
ncbi:MAG: hypothetical protein E7638_04245 [Ruminococcaceae bacterium]|nr:hypothetical protein [Oscillospiraceae bacterium]